MAVSSSCFLSLPPMPSGSKPSSIPKKTPKVSLLKTESPWKRQTVVGVSFIFMALGLGVGNDFSAMADDLELAVETPSRRVERWSDRRNCPAWQSNSLESIMPENLPRPSARRRWENVGFGRTAPAVKMTVNANCFTT